MKRLVCAIILCIFAFPVAAQINTERMMAIGQNALYFEDYVLSIQYFNQVIKAKPRLAEPYFYRAVAKLYLGDYTGAEEDCSKALECNNFMVKIYLCRSYVRIHLKKYVEAVADCQKGLEFDQENSGLMLNKGLAQTYAKKYEEAILTLGDYIHRNASSVNGYMIRGELYADMGDTLSAVDDFSRAVAVDRLFAPGYAARGGLYLSMKNYSNALSDLDEAIRLEPDNALYYINRGLTRYNRNDLRGTLSDFDRSIELDPNSKLAYFDRGLIRSQVGDLNRAVDDFDKVVFLEPDNYMAIYNRGLIKQEIGDFKGAVADLTVIIDRYPDFIPAYYQRSEVRKKMGDAKGADKDYFAAWNMEDKLRRERQNRKSTLSVVAVTDTMDKKNNIANYSKVIVADNDDKSYNNYQNPMRGRVQDRNVEVHLEEMFYLTYYEKAAPGLGRKIMDCSKYVSEMVRAGAESVGKLLITNREQPLSTLQADAHFKSIDAYSIRMAQMPGNAALFFARGIDFALVQDLSSAIGDLNQALQWDDKMVLAYFERANLRYRKMNVECENKPDESDQSIKRAWNTDQKASDSNTVGTGKFSIGESIYGVDYELVMRDYEKVLALDPKFVYAWYNRANIRCMQRDYRNALVDYTKAIELNADFAEAWFNRGITRIRLGDRERGLGDLRMAGQLGMYKAYNIIKRFSGE